MTLARIEAEGLADTAEGHWGLVDPGFAGWITSGNEGAEESANLPSIQEPPDR